MHLPFSAAVACPFMAQGSTGTGTAHFDDIPKDARNLKFTITDAGSGQTYDEQHPICKGTTMTVAAPKLTSGATTDSYQLAYTLTSDGSADPLEEHDVVVTAEWDRESDIGAVRRLLARDRLRWRRRGRIHRQGRKPQADLRALAGLR